LPTAASVSFPFPRPGEGENLPMASVRLIGVVVA